MLSGFDPRFILQGIAEAMVDEKELDSLTKTWSDPQRPAAIIAIPVFGSGSREAAQPAPDHGTTDSSVPALGMKLTRILQSSQDNRQRQSCGVSWISDIVICSAHRGGLAIRALAPSLLSWWASHAAVGLAISGGAL